MAPQGRLAPSSARPATSSTPRLAGAWAMIIVAILLIVAALLIGYDGWKAYRRYSKGAAPTTAPAPAGK